MSETAESPAAVWQDAALAAAVFAVEPAAIGGLVLRAPAGPIRDRWLALVRELLPPTAPLRRVPAHASDDRLLGGLDLAATLRAGRPVAERGILVETDGGAVMLAMAERSSSGTAARIAAALDTGEVVLERDGLALRTPTRFGVLALDEGVTAEEHPPAALLERLAIHLDLTSLAARDADGPVHTADEVAAARALLPSARVPDAVLQAICATAMALGIASVRVPILALQVARTAAALAGRAVVCEADAAVAGRLVLAARATCVPAEDPPAEEEPDRPTPAESDAQRPSDGSAAEDDSARHDEALSDVVLAATKAAIPAGLLAQLQLAGGTRGRQRSPGKAGLPGSCALRGRPAGVRRGEPQRGARLNVVETLRAAAPWQRLRQRSGQQRTGIEVRREDFRVSRFRQRAQTSTIFVVDASGSAALHRLAEAKGAVELLLADCYVRRDRVALLAFRGRTAELLLPPTRSLARAKRSLAGLPGGGATPLAAGIDAAAALADAVRRKGDTPIVIVLTDGRANMTRDGAGGRARAEQEALAAARAVRLAGVTALLVDTSPRPQPLAGQLATEMGAAYLPLPHADAGTLSRAVQAATAA